MTTVNVYILTQDDLDYIQSTNTPTVVVVPCDYGKGACIEASIITQDPFTYLAPRFSGRPTVEVEIE